MTIGLRALIAALALSPAGCASAHSAGSPPGPSADQLWIASTCAPASPDTTGWTRHTLRGVSIALPAEFRVSESVPYTLVLRSASVGSLRLTLVRGAQYMFEEMNRARRNQNWCRGGLGGYPAEFVAWKEGNYHLGVRVEGPWRAQDNARWLLASFSARNLEGASLLRDALHTIEAVPSR